MNGTPQRNEPGTSWLLRAWQFLSQPHPSVEKVGQRRRAQLLAMITFILSALFIVALLFRPSSYSAFITLLIVTGISYGLSRTRFQRAGSYFF